MEVELKYLIEDKLAQERILQDQYLQETMQPGSYEEIHMQATYFDTAKLDLCAHKMALRVRFENGEPVATLKWGGSSENGLHVRGELNMHVSEEFAHKPDIEVFAGSDIYEEIAAAAGGKELLPLMEVEFLRRQLMVDTGRSIDVVSLDLGQVKTPRGSSDIAELEIELYSGEREDMLALGSRLAAKYNLKTCDISKFQRGLALLAV